MTMTRRFVTLQKGKGDSSSIRANMIPIPFDMIPA
jgi:hypothetical protein